MKNGIKPLFPYVVLDNKNKDRNQTEELKGWPLMFKSLDLNNRTENQCTLIRALEKLDDFRIRQQNVELAFQFGLKLNEDGQPDLALLQ